MKINRKQLICCLDTASLALGNAISEFKYQCFGFHNNVVQTTDGEVSIEAQLPIDIGIDCSIHGRSFLSLLESLDEEEVDLRSDGPDLIVSTNKVEGKLVIHNLNEFKGYSSNLNKTNTIPKVKEFVDGLIKCRHNVSLDATSKMALHGVRIDDVVILSTNKFRIFKCRLGFKSGIDCIVPTKFIDILSKCKDEVRVIRCEDESRLVALIDGKVNAWIWTQLLVGDYPDLNKYFSRPTNSVRICLPDDIDQVMSRHSLFVKDVDISNRESLVSIDGCTCVIKTTNVNVGVLCETVTLKSKPIINKDSPTQDDVLINGLGFGVKFYVDPVLIKDIIKECKNFSYYTEDKSMVFITEKFDYLVQVTV